MNCTESLESTSPRCLASAGSLPTRSCARLVQTCRRSACVGFRLLVGLCPERQISGGKVLFTKSRRVKSRLALALRIGAKTLHHADNYLGEFFRRIARRLGKPQAITATAHKLARIVFHLLRRAYLSGAKRTLKDARNFGYGDMRPSLVSGSYQPRTAVVQTRVGGEVGWDFHFECP